MAYWLLKSEPDAYSWSDLVATGDKGEPWTGVRNHTAKLNLMAMKVGDRAFFYHSQEGKEIVGIAEVIREHYIDPTDPKGIFVCVDVKAVEPLPKPFTLADAKADPALASMSLVTSFRLSVQPVTEAEWKHVLAKSGL
ncbi:EVE domain-containing protein [Caulobacter mirabilis]|uniref:Ubiquinol-cytochrome C reductase n=1 Tax=Caulobacter mirabilis TaxID=69666 RepID=A0A2D2B0Q7_9CAUL|nr:EVE domain-containing protein [Caulobacter mirabilis]ATQ43840.1 ubiquinol-cytochrome C reductase [Caulobacter mirabilis]